MDQVGWKHYSLHAIVSVTGHQRVDVVFVLCDSIWTQVLNVNLDAFIN